MKTFKNAIIVCFVFALCSFAQIGSQGDSVYTVPAHPTVKDSITYNYYNANACCCSEFVNPVVGVSDSIVYLSFSLNTDLCATCKCLVAGTWHAFKGGKLPAGKYSIFREQSFYCPPPRLCPMIAVLPVKIGEFVVTSGTNVQTGMSAKKSTQNPLPILQGNGRGLFNFVNSQPGNYVVKIFNAQGILVNETAVGPAARLSATPGVYLMTMETNGRVIATQKFMVSR